MSIFWSNPVETGLSQKLFLFKLKVRYSVPTYRHASIKEVRLVEPGLVNCLTRKSCKKTNPELWQHEKQTFVETVYNNERVAPVSFSAVKKNQRNQKAKLTDRKVGRSCRLSTLQAANANSDISRCNHVYIVSTIANG